MTMKKIPYEIIVAAKSGDGDAMNAILQKFSPYILRYSKRAYYDDYGNRHEFVDEEIRQNIEVKLMLGIIYKYDPAQLPSGEVLIPIEENVNI